MHALELTFTLIALTLNRCRYTSEDKQLYRAFKMAEQMQNEKVLEAIATTFDPQRQSRGVADFPYSLMEGFAGTISYHCDLLHPQTAAFPGYDGEVSPLHMYNM